MSILVEYTETKYHGSVVCSRLANLGNSKSAENKLDTPSYSHANYGVVRSLFMHMVFLGPAKVDKLSAALPHLQYFSLALSENLLKCHETFLQIPQDSVNLASASVFVFCSSKRTEIQQV